MSDREMLQRIDVTNRLLARIAAALEAQAIPSEPSDVPGECQHEPDKRVVFSGMGDLEEWTCSPSKGGCGYQHLGTVAACG